MTQLFSYFSIILGNRAVARRILSADSPCVCRSFSTETPCSRDARAWFFAPREPGANPSTGDHVIGPVRGWHASSQYRASPHPAQTQSRGSVRSLLSAAPTDEPEARPVMRASA